MSMFFIVYAKHSFEIGAVQHITKKDAEVLCEGLKEKYPFSYTLDKSRCADVQVLGKTGYFLVKANGVAGAEDKVVEVLENRELVDWVKELRSKGLSELDISRKIGCKNTAEYREAILKAKGKMEELVGTEK